jgi:outer membrane protease
MYFLFKSPQLMSPLECGKSKAHVTTGVWRVHSSRYTWSAESSHCNTQLDCGYMRLSMHLAMRLNRDDFSNFA